MAAKWLSLCLQQSVLLISLIHRVAHKSRVVGGGGTLFAFPELLHEIVGLEVVLCSKFFECVKINMTGFVGEIL